MTTAVQHRRGTTAEHSTFTGLEGEVTIDTTKDTAVIHDGVLAGGYALAKENLANVTTSGLASIDGASTASDDKFFIYDQSATTLKTITRAELNNAIEQDALANVAITGGTINGTAIGGSTAAAGAFTTLTTSSTVTLNGGTANGVAYLNGSKVLTTGSALTFDGTNLLVGGTTGTAGGKLTVTTANGGYAAIEPTSSVTSQIATGLRLHGNINETDRYVGIFCYNGAANNVNSMTFWTTSGSVPAERMRLDNLGNLGIGTSSPQVQLHLQSSAPVIRLTDTSASTDAEIFCNSAAGSMYLRADHTNVAANSVIGFQIDGSDKMTLDSSGNLGLGVTPSASAGAKAINIGSIGYVFGDGSIYKYNAGITSNAYVNGNGTFAAIQSRGAGVFEIDDGVFKWRQASSGTAGSTLSLTQAMTLDASGNLGVGATSPTFAAGTGLQVKGAGFTSVRVTAGAYTGLDISQTNSTGDAYVYLRDNAPLIFGTNNSERARITSGGYFKASDNGTYDGSTGAYHEFYQSANNSALFIRAVNAGLNTGGVLGITADRNTTDNTFYALSYYNNGAAAYKFRVADSGNVTNTNGTYGTISDAKMKTDIVNAGSQWSDIKALRFRKFKMKNDPSGLVQLGVVAQEVELTSPGLVDEHADKDAEGNDLGTTTKSVKTSVLLMKAAVALQEAMARIEQLEAKVAALESK